MKPPRRIEMEDFKQILDQEIEIHTAMEQYLEQKKTAIIQGDLNTLMAIDDELEKMTQRIRELEKDRVALMVEMGREGETLKTFIASLESGEDSRILEEARTKLLHATQQIKSLSATNRDLLTQSIRFIEQSVNFIASILAPEGSSYTHLQPGRTTGESKPDPQCDIPSTISREA